MFFICHCFFWWLGGLSGTLFYFWHRQRLFARRKQWLVANLRVYLELTQPRLWNVQLLWNKHFIFKWHICWFFSPSESLMLFHFPLTKSKTSSWTLQRSSFRRFGNKQNVIWRKHSQCIIDDIITPRANRTHRQTHSIAGKMALWASCRVLSGCDFKVQVETGDQKETHTCFYLQVLQ